MLLHDMSHTYAYSLLFYKVYMKRENAGSWNSGLEKEQILETYSAQLQKSWNSTEVVFENNKKYWAEEIPEGGHPSSTRVGARPTPWVRPPALWAPWQPSCGHLLLYEVFYPAKNHKQAFGKKLRRHEAEPWRNQSRAPAEPLPGKLPSGRGKSSPSSSPTILSSGGGQSPSTSSPAPSPLKP